MKNTKMKELLQKLGTLMALAILVLIFCITMPDKFMKVGNFMNILKQAQSTYDRLQASKIYHK